MAGFIFTNTKKSSHLRQFIWAILCIMSVEVFLVGGVIFFLIPKGQTFFIIFTIIIVVYLYAFYSLYIMLIARHKLISDKLTICLGSRFKKTFPVSLITSIGKINLSSFPNADIVGVMVLREGDCLYCMSRKSDIVRICLSEKIMVKAPEQKVNKSKRGMVSELVINVDEPEAFLEKLAEVASFKLERDQNQLDKINSTLEIDIKNNLSELDIKSEILEADRQPSLELRNLTRYYRDYPAVQNVSLKVYPGEIFGFLGANGAGKSTSIKMITGLLKPSSGSVWVKGEDIWKPGTSIRRKIGYIPDNPLIYERLTLREHLLMVGELYSIQGDILKERINETIIRLGLHDSADKTIATYSLGMQRKASVALALLFEPEIVIVDELTNAFDALTLSDIKGLLLNLRRDGKTVFLSTHVMDVAEKLCDRLAILHKGHLVATGTVKELCENYGVTGGLEDLFLRLTSPEGEVRGSIS